MRSEPATREKPPLATPGIGENTLGDWLRKSRDFRDRVEHAEAECEVRLVALVLTAAAVDAKHAEWWLERRRPDDYGRRDRVELDIRQQALQVAQAYGLDPNEVLREAEQWLTR